MKTLVLLVATLSLARPEISPRATETSWSVTPRGGPRFPTRNVDAVLPAKPSGLLRAIGPGGRELALEAWPAPPGRRRGFRVLRGAETGRGSSIRVDLKAGPPARGGRRGVARHLTRGAKSWLLTGRGMRLEVPRDPALVLVGLRTAAGRRPFVEELALDLEAEGPGQIELVEASAALIILHKSAPVRDREGGRFRLDLRYAFRPRCGALRLRLRLTSRDVSGRRAVRAVARGRRPRREGKGASGSRRTAPLLETDRDGADPVGLGRIGPPRLGWGRPGRGPVLEFVDARTHGPLRVSWLGKDKGTLHFDVVPDVLDWWPGQRAGRDLVLAASPKELGGGGGTRVEPRGRGTRSAPRVFGDLETALVRDAGLHLATEAPRGMRDAGDFLWGPGRAGNLEYDLLAGLLALTDAGHASSLDALARGLRHLLDRDLDRFDTGLPRRHGPRHRGPVDLGHVWLEGPLVAADVLADRWAAEDLVGVIVAFRGRVDRELEGPWSTRDLGWSLLNLAVLYERYAAEEDARRIHSLLDHWIASFRGGWPRGDPLPGDGAVFISSWIGPGVLGEALARVPASPQRKEARRCYRRFLERLLDVILNAEPEGEAGDEVDAEIENGVRRGVVLDREGREHASRSRLEGEELGFLALGVARAAAWGKPLAIDAVTLMSRAREQRRYPKRAFPAKRLAQCLWVASRRSRP